jgi:hypothetical protein
MIPTIQSTTRGFTADIRPDPYRAPTREQIERARAMYREGFTVSRILAMTDMALGTLYYWLDGGPEVRPLSMLNATSGKPDVDGGPSTGPTTADAAVGGEGGRRLLAPIPRRKVVVGKRRRPLDTDRVSLAARLWRTAERQVRDIEERLARPAASGPDRERDVRMLTGLIRGLRDLDMFDRARGGAAAFDRAAEPEDPEAEQRRVADLRASVARKIEAIIAERGPKAKEGGG